MTTTQPTQTPATVEPVLARIAELYDEPEWLTQARREAWDAYTRAPMPDRVTHLWRYSDPKVFDLEAPFPPDLPAEAAQARRFPQILTDALAHDALGAGVSVREGLVWKTAVDTEYAAAGLLVEDLHEAANRHPDLVQPHLGSLINADFGRFEALINATWAGGLFIYVPRNLRVTKPIHVVTSQPGSAAFIPGRLLVVVAEGAELTLIDEYGDGVTTDGAPVHAHRIVEMKIGAGARVQYTPIQNWNRTTTSYLTQRAHLSRDAKLDTVLAAVGSQTSKVNCGSILAEPGAESNIFGLAIGDDSQHYDHRTVHEHQSGRTLSDIKFKVALRDKADSIYTGLIRIDEDAEFCEAYQENRNLILSPDAKAETIPELEILNNEVRCSHGATVGRIDDQEVFYLGARGIDPAEAVRLIVSGFVAPIVDHLPDVVRGRLRDVIIRRLEGN